MNTTNIFVELVVIGFHTLIGISIIVLSFFGYENIEAEKLLTINLALPVLATAYILGILVDRIADRIFLAQDHKMRPPGSEANSPSFLTMRFYILHKSSDIYAQLEYIRSRLRIARAAIFNFVLMTFSVLLFVWLQLGESLPAVSLILLYVGTLIVGAVLALVSYQSWRGLVTSYSISTIRAYSMLRDEELKSQSEIKVNKEKA